VRGYADQMLRVPSNPLDPSNRRISLIVQWVEATPPPATTSLPMSADVVSGQSKTTAVEPPANSGPAAATAVPPTAGAAGDTQATSPAPTQKQGQTAPRIASASTWESRMKALIPGKKK